MANPAPIKRSKQLAPLSRDHHDTLLFTWKIKQGLAKGTPVETIISYVAWYWNNFLQKHFEEEEKLLLPVLPANDELAKQLQKEHEDIRRAIGAPLDSSSLAHLSGMINDHIRFEERQFFPYTEKKLGEQQLNDIYQQLDQQPHCNEKWENEFWIAKR